MFSCTCAMVGPVCANFLVGFAVDLVISFKFMRSVAFHKSLGASGDWALGEGRLQKQTQTQPQPQPQPTTQHMHDTPRTRNIMHIHPQTSTPHDSRIPHDISRAMTRVDACV